MPAPTTQFFTGRMPFLHPTNSVKALKAKMQQPALQNASAGNWHRIEHCSIFMLVPVYTRIQTSTGNQCWSTVSITGNGLV